MTGCNFAIGTTSRVDPIAKSPETKHLPNLRILNMVISRNDPNDANDPNDLNDLNDRETLSERVQN
jgi:hypothetical protein